MGTVLSRRLVPLLLTIMLCLALSPYVFRPMLSITMPTLRPTVVPRAERCAWRSEPKKSTSRAPPWFSLANRQWLCPTLSVLVMVTRRLLTLVV